jgi:hypothetical protein
VAPPWFEHQLKVLVHLTGHEIWPTFLKRRKTMNTIRFSFEDLCVFFSRYTSRLMVGLISTEDEAPENVHQPHIVIKRNGVVDREYHTFDVINGDICLEVLPEGKPLTRYVPQSPGDPRRPIDMMVDLENDLHPNEPLQIDPMKCRARLYFKNGEFYSTNPFINARFNDVKTGQVCEHAPTELAVKAGLDVEIPEDGYAVLRFFNGTEDFIFQSGDDYQVEIINLAKAITGDHFKYFYNIVHPQPEQIWYFAAGEKLGLPVPGYGGDVECSGTLDGNVIWTWFGWLNGKSESDSETR